MGDAFPISMMENRFGWKLEAKLPPNASSKRFFDLFINGKNFFTHYFVQMTESASNVLKGVIILNGIVFLDEGQVFQWTARTAENRMAKKLGQGQKIDTLVLRNIDCSSVVF